MMAPPENDLSSALSRVERIFAGEELYSWLEALLTELTDMLPSTMFHIGGDEVQYQCWESSPKIVAYLAKRNMTGVQLYQEFEYRMYVGPGCWLPAGC